MIYYYGGGGGGARGDARGGGGGGDGGGVDLIYMLHSVIVTELCCFIEVVPVICLNIYLFMILSI